MAVRNSINLDQDPCSIIGSRAFDAPRALVFSVWTNPKHLAQWWGPTALLRRRIHTIFVPAASGASSCMDRTAATIRIALPLTESFRLNASSITTAAAMTLNRCSSHRR